LGNIIHVYREEVKLPLRGENRGAGVRDGDVSRVEKEGRRALRDMPLV
jgi:hypothetical protein